ncbi:MAG: ABC transporter substrate-binding protein [Chloroflexi bacterium]|nr:ABC transporter substrate-binding protein [Chloroflexota bacterium]
MATKKLFPTIVWLLAAPLLVASCAPAAAPVAKQGDLAAKPQAEGRTPVPAAPAPTLTPAAQQPRYGGIVELSIRTEPRHYDMHGDASQTAIWSFSPAYNGLLQNDPLEPGKIVPDLVESWTVSLDGTTYTFKLREGVKWHDGNPLTTADVLLSMEKLKKHVQVGPGLEAVKSVAASDDSAVKVSMSYPAAAFPSFMAISWAAMIPQHILDKKGSMKEDVVGTGAFKLKRHNRSVSLELEKNRDYFLPGRPYLDGLRTYFVSDQSAANAALRAGRVNFIVGLSTVSMMRLKEVFKEGTVADHPVGKFPSLFLPVDKAPWTDIRVRKAVHLGIDRQAAVNILTDGQGTIGGYIPEAMGGIPTEELLKKPGYRQPKDADIAEAKRLLAEAGYPNGLKTSVLYRMGGEYEAQAVFLRDQLGKIGIDLAIKTLDDAGFYDLREKRAYDSHSGPNSVTVNEPDLLLKRFYKGGSPSNYSNLNDPELDKLIELQSREQDPVKRKAIIRQANERLEELIPLVVLLWSGGMWRAWQSKVKNYRIPQTQHDGERFVNVWLADK